MCKDKTADDSDLGKAVTCLNKALNNLEEEWINKSESEKSQTFDANENESSKNGVANESSDNNTKDSCLNVKDALEKLLNSPGWESITDESKTDESEPSIKEKICALDTYHNLAHLAEHYFTIIQEALKKSLEKPVTLKPATDTGWFTYLYCREIDEVKNSG